MNVTVTGGVGNSPISLSYNAFDNAYLYAQELAGTIDQLFTSATYYDPNHPGSGGASGYLIVAQDVAGNKINAGNFSYVVDQNNGVASAVEGGLAGDQVVLAGDGGLMFHGRGSNTTVVAGGGNNYVTFDNQGGDNAVYLSEGDNTVLGGTGTLLVEAGSGINKIVDGSGTTLIYSTGHDGIVLGSGTASVTVGAGGSDYIIGAKTDTSSAQYNLTFIGGDEASTVLAGAGSYSIFGGAGGGVFHGGTSGDNSILGGSGSVTIKGGGAGDSLFGGSGGGVIRAGSGNETLGGGGGNTRLVGGSGPDYFVVGAGNETVVAGSGSDTIQFMAHVGGTGVTDMIDDFNSQDLISLTGFDQNAVAYALDTFKSNGTNGSFQLEDGTKVVLIGVTHISASNFN